MICLSAAPASSAPPFHWADEAYWSVCAEELLQKPAELTPLTSGQRFEEGVLGGVDPHVEPSQDALLGRVRKQVGEITQRLWGDLPAADLQVAGRVLSTVLERAEAELETG